VVPGLSAANIFSYSVTHAASEMRHSTWCEERGCEQA
jgi:hypothetical protein